MRNKNESTDLKSNYWTYRSLIKKSNLWKRGFWLMALAYAPYEPALKTRVYDTDQETISQSTLEREEFDIGRVLFCDGYASQVRDRLSEH